MPDTDIDTEKLLAMYRHIKGLAASVERSLLRQGFTRCRECQDYHKPNDPHVSPSDSEAPISTEFRKKA